MTSGGEKPRSRLRRLTGVEVLATGSYVPEQIVTNDDLQRTHGFDPEWVWQRTGIRQRRYAPSDMATSDLAVRAGRNVIQRAGVSADDVDLLLVATFTPDLTCPATACLVQDQLGMCAPACDIVAACSGFVYALATAAQFVAAGTSELALVIGADCNTRILDPHDQRTYPLFGDGAGAVLLRRGGAEQGLLAYELGSDGAGAPLLQRSLGGTRTRPVGQPIATPPEFLHMDGRAVFKWAIRLVAASVTDVLRHAGLAVADVDLAIFHQANIRIIDAAAETLDIPKERLFVNLDRYGNTSGGSIPLALDEAVAQGRLRRGDRVLVCGFGAGLAWGTAVLQW